MVLNSSQSTGTELSRTGRVLFADNICPSLNIYYFSNGGIFKNFRYITSSNAFFTFFDGYHKIIGIDVRLKPAIYGRLFFG